MAGDDYIFEESEDASVKRWAEAKKAEIHKRIESLLEEAHALNMKYNDARKWVINKIMLDIARDSDTPDFVRALLLSKSSKNRQDAWNIVAGLVDGVIEERREGYRERYKKIIGYKRTPKWKEEKIKEEFGSKYFGKKEYEELESKHLEKMREEAEKKWEYKKEKGDEKKNLLSVHYSKHFSQVAGSVMLLIIGLAMSAILGVPWFFVAFMCWIVYNILPAPRDDYNPIQKRVKDIEKKLQNGEISADEARALSETEAVIADIIQKKKTGELWRYRGKFYGKYLFRWVGFAFFAVAFAVSPLLKPIAIVVALIAYFMVE